MTMKIQGGQKKPHISYIIFFDWPANKNPPWSAYQEFMPDRIIAIYKWSGAHLVEVRKTWRRLFAKCVLRVKGPEYTNECQYEQLCADLKEVIDGAVHGVEAI